MESLLRAKDDKAWILCVRTLKRGFVIGYFVDGSHHHFPTHIDRCLISVFPLIIPNVVVAEFLPVIVLPRFDFYVRCMD